MRPGNVPDDLSACVGHTRATLAHLIRLNAQRLAQYATQGITAELDQTLIISARQDLVCIFKLERRALSAESRFTLRFPQGV